MTFMSLLLLSGLFSALLSSGSSLTKTSAAAPYRIVGAFNGWGESNAIQITDNTTKISGERVFYTKQAISGEWKIKSDEDNWNGYNKLHDGAKGSGFQLISEGNDNLLMPTNDEYTILVYEGDNGINIFRNIYLTGNINGWTTADSNLIFTQNSTKPWLFDIEHDLTIIDQLKINFGSWTGALAGHNLAEVSKSVYGFIDVGGNDHNIGASGANFHAGTHVISLDLVNYIITLSPTADNLSSEIMSYPAGAVTLACEENYAKIKPRVVNLIASQLEEFKTSTDPTVVAARARYTQWAIANGEDSVEMYSNTELQQGDSVLNTQRVDNSLTATIIIGVIGITTIAGYYFITKKSEQRI